MPKYQQAPKYTHWSYKKVSDKSSERILYGTSERDEFGFCIRKSLCCRLETAMDEKGKSLCS
jgi:hypothetical protein